MFNFKSYSRAGSIEEAIQLLQENPEAHIIAGGTDVLVKLHKAKETLTTWSIFTTSPSSISSAGTMTGIWSSDPCPALRTWQNPR